MDVNSFSSFGSLGSCKGELHVWTQHQNNFLPLLQPDTRRVALIWIWTCRLVRIDSTLDPCTVTAVVIYICHLHSCDDLGDEAVTIGSSLLPHSSTHISTWPPPPPHCSCVPCPPKSQQWASPPQWKQAWSGYPPWRWWIDGSLTGKAGGLRVNKCRAALNMKEGKENTRYLSAATDSTGMRFTHAR